MSNTNKYKACVNEQILNALDHNEDMIKKLMKVAQYESEMHFGVNPFSKEQAHTHYLSEKDFGYIYKVCTKISELLGDSEWIQRTISCIQERANITNSLKGLSHDDELFKVGRGILQGSLKEMGNKY